MVIRSRSGIQSRSRLSSIDGVGSNVNDVNFCLPSVPSESSEKIRSADEKSR